MRLEISAGGLTGSIAIAEYQSNFSNFVTSVESMISSFKAVKSETHNLSGGVGNLQDALENIDARIRKEEEKKADAVTVQKKSNDFLELAVRVDRQVATLVNQNKEEFYRVNPWLRPAPPEREKAWYEKAWDTICDVGKAIGDGIGQAWNWVKDTAGKIWDGLVEFYKEYKQIIDTILVAVGAVVAVVAVIATGGVALVPLLGALGVSTTAAIAISTAVAVTAVVSTVAASAMNIVDIWCDIDNPVFNRIQKALNITSAITNTTYSIGNIYNSFKGVSGQEYIASHKTYNDVSQLSGKQVDAFARYTGDEYRNINNSLRGLDVATPENADAIKTMSTVLDNSSLPEDMVLYRGTTTKALGDLKNLAPEELVGKTFVEEGFMSTSTSSVVSNAFKSDMHITIEAAKGAHALNVSAISGFPESEVLFGAGQEMLITAAEKTDGIMNITVLVH